LLAVVAAPFFRKVDLVAIGDSVELDLAIQEPCFLRGFRGGGAAGGREIVLRRI
jgi:hypothetical protein